MPHGVIALLALFATLQLAAYVVMNGNRTLALRLYKGLLLALVALLSGEAMVRLAPPGSGAFAVGARMFLYPGQAAALVLLFLFARAYPARRPAPAGVVPAALIGAVCFGLYPYLFAPAFGELPAGPWGFVLPGALDRAAFGAAGAAARALFFALLLLDAAVGFARALLACPSAGARTPLLYLALCAWGPLALGAATEWGLPLATGIPVYPLFSAGALLAALAFSAAMTRHEMLEMRLVVRETLLYALLTALVSGGYLLAAQVGHVVFHLILPASTFVASYLLLLFSLLIIAPLRNWLQQLLDRTVFRGRTDAALLLRELFALLSTVDDRQRLAPQALSALRRHLRLESAALVLPGNAPPVILSGGDERYRTAPEGLPAESALLAWFAARPGERHLAVNSARIAGEPEKLAAVDEAARLPWIRASAVVPLRDAAADGEGTGKLVGLLVLGDRDDRRPLAVADLPPVAAVAEEMARALARLRAFEADGRKRTAGQRAHGDDRLAQALRDERRALDRLRGEIGRNASRAALEKLLDEEERRVEAALRRIPPKRGQGDAG